MMTQRWIALAVVALAGCAGEPEPPEPKLDEAAVIAASVPIAESFQAELKAQLQAAIAAAQSEASGAAISRIAEKHRNPAGGVPDDVREAYAALAAAPLVEGKPNRQIVQTGSGEGAKVHVLSAIPMQEQPCSVCHGTNIDPDLKAHIDSLYPGDLATGFSPGELRGALLVSWDAGRFVK